jgi:hypothetical protein
MPIVSDAGPILSFARSGLLELLRSVVRELVIPQQSGMSSGPVSGRGSALSLSQRKCGSRSSAY